MNIRHVLVLCVGNICRSPMAEALLRDALRAKDDITVTSAGLGALVDHPADEHAVALMHERGIDITGHRARQVNEEMFREADVILVMETTHKKIIEMTYPALRGKLYRLGEWRDTDINDPYRQPRAVFEQALAAIEDGVADWAGKILA